MLAEDVSVGPFSVIGPNVEIGAGSVIGPHVVIKGPTKIGKENKIFQFSSIGEDPQDMKYAGEPTRLEIGDRNVIREYCTLNRGTTQDLGYTRVGNDNWIMAYVHIAHDCIIENNVIMANNATLAGHVIIEDYVILGGFTLVHQFCTVGAHCFTGMGSAINKDVPPYLMVSGQMAQPHGLNSEGLKRRGFSAEAQQALRKAYKIIYRSSLTLEQAREEMQELAAQFEEVQRMLTFLNKVKRGIVR
jgi:UDP-N-acetylglucosamine acyltransferase